MPQELVRLSGVPMLVNRLLIPALPQLYARYPRLRIELIAEARNASLTRREADVALRLARPEGGSAVLAKCLGHLEYAVYGPRKCAADHLPWITYEEGLSHLPQARWIATATHDGELAPLLVSDAEAIVHAMHAGLGKSLLPCFGADRDSKLRRLSNSKAVLNSGTMATHAQRIAASRAYRGRSRLVDGVG